MKRTFTLLFLLLLSVSSFSQISVETLDFIGFTQKLKTERVEKFKSLKTIFILPNIYDQESYNEILKEVWDVTPYELINVNDFNLGNYLSQDVAIVSMNSTTFGGGKLDLVDFRIYKGSSMTEDFDELYEKEEKKRKKDEKELKEKTKTILRTNSKGIARIFLYVKPEYRYKLYVNLEDRDADTDEHFTKMLNTTEVFYNYNLGFLKNYLQKINNLIKAGGQHNYRSTEYIAELSNLKTNKLYIPSYLSITYNSWIDSYKDSGEQKIHKVFKKYDYEYEVIDTDDLSKKILSDEEFYYLRYARLNGESFIEIVNSKTGEIVFHDHRYGVKNANFSSRFVSDLNRKIEKAEEN